MCKCYHESPAIIANHLNDDMDPSYSTSQCSTCGELDINAPEFISPLEEEPFFDDVYFD